jgi:hypothetical protein
MTPPDKPFWSHDTPKGAGVKPVRSHLSDFIITFFTPTRNEKEEVTPTLQTAHLPSFHAGSRTGQAYDRRLTRTGSHWKGTCRPVGGVRTGYATGARPTSTHPYGPPAWSPCWHSYLHRVHPYHTNWRWVVPYWLRKGQVCPCMSPGPLIPDLRSEILTSLSDRGVTTTPRRISETYMALTEHPFRSNR